MVLEILAREMQCTQIGKEEAELSLFANAMIPYFKNSKGSTRRILDLINTFRKSGSI
jgi:hypothetical protein